MSVLGKNQILSRLDEFFPKGGDPDRVKAAKYYLTLSGSFLIKPDGERFGRDKERARSLLLQPGQTAYVSSKEHVLIPANFVGILGPRFSSSEQGLFFFGGMLVDPGWGMTGGEPTGEPLSFTIANLGHSPIELRPGKDVIASLAFMKVKGAGRKSKPDREAVERPIQLREELFDGTDKPPSALGWVGELRAIRDQVDKLEKAQNQVTLLVVIVLAASLLAGLVASILGFSDDSGSSELSAGSLEATAWGFGLVVVGVLAVVVLFYLILFVRNRWTARQGGNRLRS